MNRVQIAAMLVGFVMKLLFLATAIMGANS